MRRSRIRRFGLVVISEETEDFVWVPVGHGNVGPPLRTRTAERMNMHDGMWCRVASTFAIFTKRHFAALLNYMPQVPVNLGIRPLNRIVINLDWQVLSVFLFLGR